MQTLEPSYLKLLKTGELTERVEEAYKHLMICDVCALECPVDRLAGRMGVCNTGERAKVSSYGPHMGEENPIRGFRGSGTIFFTGCNLRCQYCQNHDISQGNTGYEIDPEDLAAIMLDLQNQGCHNINFVSPSHVIPQILAGVLTASLSGLKIPLVYNTGGYDSITMLQLLEGVIDIYMPDMKYADPRVGHRYSKVPNYPSVNRKAIKEMYRQVGALKINKNGIAIRGLLVRHLVLPENLSGTKNIIQFLADEISPNTYLNLMDQYRPEYKAHRFPILNRRISIQEYQQTVRWSKEAGLKRLDRRHL